MKAAGRWRRVLLVDEDTHRRETLIQSPVRFLQILATESVEQAFGLLERAPFDVLLLAEDLLSSAYLPGLLTLKRQQPFLRLWLLRETPQPGSLHELALPEKIFHWPVSVTDIQLALEPPLK